MTTMLDAVAGYIKLRDLIKLKRTKQKEDMAPLDAKLYAIESWILNDLDRQGAKNVKTAEGTAFVATRVSLSLHDKDAFLHHLISTNEWALADLRASKTAIQEHLEMTGELPPGVSLSSEFVARVRR